MRVDCGPQERTQRERFDGVYLRSREPVMRAIERSVCGCDYGGNSWTTRAQADSMAELLELEPGMRLLEVGAGSGWPGLYVAGNSGCDVVLTDMPFEGLCLAMQRAAEERAQEKITGTCGVVLADAATLPFEDASFDAVSHSDVLCCLSNKGAVLRACRRVVRDHGRMVFSVIYIAPELAREDYARAVANGPEFIESNRDYSTLLSETGWRVLNCRDVTDEYATSCQRQLDADAEHKTALIALIGAKEYDERQADWRAKLSVLKEGLLRRALFLAEPV